MAEYAGNNFYLKIDSTDMSAYVVDGTLTPKVNEVDTTAGAGTTYMKRQAGLKDTSGSWTIAVDDTNFPAQIAACQPGVHTIEWGPQGATTGKPRHVQSMLISEAPIDTKVTKDMHAFKVSASGAAAPTVDMMAGGVYS